jgi:hypothetical protein
MPFPSFWFVGALYVAWVFFTWVYFLLDFFFFRTLTANGNILCVKIFARAIQNAAWLGSARASVLARSSQR